MCLEPCLSLNSYIRRINFEDVKVLKKCDGIWKKKTIFDWVKLEDRLETHSFGDARLLV